MGKRESHWSMWSSTNFVDEVEALRPKRDCGVAHHKIDATLVATARKCRIGARPSPVGASEEKAGRHQAAVP